MDEVTQISKIHLLIHPGYLARLEETIEGFSFSELFPAGDYEQYRPEVEAYLESLFERYREKSQHLNNDEVMVVILQGNFSELKQEIKGESTLPEALQYRALIDELKANLGRRLVVVNETRFGMQQGLRNSEKPMREIFTHVQSVLHARGYTFDETVLTEAFGECINACVEERAHNFNREGNLQSPTEIQLDATDYDAPMKDWMNDFSEQSPPGSRYRYKRPQ